MLRISWSKSWALFAFCVGVVSGVGIASWFEGLWGVMCGLFVVGIVLVCIWRNTPIHRVFFVGLVVIGMAIGVFRVGIAGPGGNSVTNDVGRAVTLEGRVVSVDYRDHGVGYVVNAVSVDDAHRADRVIIGAPISSLAQVGEYVRVYCVLREPEPFDGFAYDRYLAARGIYAECRTDAAPFVIDRDARGVADYFWQSIGVLRHGIDGTVRQMLPEPQSSLLFGLLIGADDFSDVWKTRFQQTGTSHIVAASGYNVAVVAQLVLLVLVSLGLYRKQALPLVLIALSVFVLLAGAGSAVVRAGVMGALALIARHVGRHTSPRNILAVTVVILLLLEPRVLRDDVGFQLSVTATLGLVLLTDRISGVLKGVPTAFGIRESLASTLAATLATLPVLACSFGTVSVIGPIVNMIILPFVPYAMALGGGAIVVAAWWTDAAVFVALPAWTVLVTITEGIRVAARIPFALVTIPPMIRVALSVVSITAIIAAVRKIPRSYARMLDVWQPKQIALLVGVLVILFVGHITLITWRSGRFTIGATHVFVVDVGQGDGIFIDGAVRDVAIDGGPTRRGFTENLSLVRFPWERHVDVVLATHPHADHVVGLIDLLDAYSVDEVVVNGVAYAEAGEEARTNASEGNVIHIAAGQQWDLGHGTTMKIVWPLDADVSDAQHVHDRSIVALLTVGESSMLFMGDAETAVESQIGDIGHVDVVKVGHHGSDTSSSQEFLSMIDPDLAIVSVGTGNSYGHPSPFVLARFTMLGTEILRTDDAGTVRVDLDQNGVRWYPSRKH